MFNRTFFQVEGANALIQPVYANDVVTAMINCLKMEETAGKTYELGGPHVYTYNEIYEEFYRITGIKPYIIPVKLEAV